MTKADLLKLLEPYGVEDQVVFVTFAGGITVHEHAEVAKDHCTTRTAPGGAVFMPVAIYLVDEAHRGRPGVIGGWPKAGDEPTQPGGRGPVPC